MTEKMFGPYRLDGLLGRGGMGEVWRAYHTEQDRTVALKLLLGGLGRDEEFRQRFLRESQVTARLTDPHVIPIHNWGEIDGRLYLDMRFVEGEDLGQRLARSGPLAPDRAVAVLAQVARALDSAHRAGLVHRDVKPSNVLLAKVEPDEDEFAYLVDFGIARSLSGESSGALTNVGTAIGTLDYMAPERFLEQSVDGRADVYALACVLYESLTGKRPFVADGLPGLMSAHIRKPPPRVSALAPVSAAFDGVIARGMAKDPDERYPTAGALAAAGRAVITASGSLPVASAEQKVLDAPPRSGAEGAGRPRSGPNTPYAWPTHPAPPQPAVRPPYLHPAAQQPAQRPAAQPAGGRWLPPGGPPPTSYPIPQPLLGAPQSRSTSRRRGLIAAGALLGAAAVVATVVTLSSGGANNGGGAAATTTAAPTTTEAPDSPTAAQLELLAILPLGFDDTNCTPAPAREDAQVDAAFECSSGPEGGPSSAVFLRYRTATRLDAVVEEVVTERGLMTVDLDTCRAGASVTGTWSRDGQLGGLVICYGDPNTGANLEWTEDRVLGRAIVTRSDADAAALYDWWLANDFT